MNVRLKLQFAAPRDYHPSRELEQRIDSVAVQASDANDKLGKFSNEMRGLLYDYHAVWTGMNESHRILDEIECPMSDSAESGPILPQRVRWLVDQYKELKLLLCPAVNESTHAPPEEGTRESGQDGAGSTSGQVTR